MTNSDRLQRAREIVRAAVDLAPSDRKAFFAEQCGRDAALREAVERVLAGDAASSGATGTPDTGPATAGVTGGSDSPFEQPGSVIDRYRLLQQVGEGGFGVVYEAQQEEPVRRRVALKIIKVGMDTRQVISRFEAERQALAIMGHPNIAQVLDAGATGTGRPYFVMELVEGLPITEFCDQQSMTPRERLQLFVQVCDAVQHAHLKGIIHRDIKPGNVLVTQVDGKPVAKVIDFGIAKAIDQRLAEQTMFTEFGQFVGTPAYMSPEQADPTGIDVDTRSDLYSLGVLLYELLTGVTPFGDDMLRSAGLDEIKRIIREDDPTKPSTRLSSMGDRLDTVARQRAIDPKRLGSLLRGDLDWVIMKALEKDRTRRYETADGFASDIERYLNHEPVSAGPPSGAYRLRKFVQRHRAGVFAGALLAVALLLGIAGTSWGLLWALDEKARADERLRQVEQVAAFQSEQLSGIDVESMGAGLRADLLAKVEAVAQRSQLEPDAIAARVAETERLIAGADFTGMALQTLEQNVFARAQQAIDAQFGDQPLLRARLMQTLATTLRHLGLYDRAEPLQGEVVSIRRTELGDEDAETLASIRELSLLLESMGRSDEALPLGREALEGTRRLRGDDHVDTLGLTTTLGNVLWSVGDYGEAEAHLRRALEGQRRVLGVDHADTLDTMKVLANLLRRIGDYEQAEAYAREALEGRRRTQGEGDAQTLQAMLIVGKILRDVERHEEALVYIQDLLEHQRRTLGDDHPQTLDTIGELGTLYLRMGEFEQALGYYRETVATRRRVWGDDHAYTLTALGNMGYLQQQLGDFEAAEATYREVVERQRRVLGPDHRETLITTHNLGGLLRRLGQLAEAASLAEDVVRRVDATLAVDDPFRLAAHSSSGQTLLLLDRFDEAEVHFLETHARRLGTVGPDHRKTHTMTGRLVELYEAWHAAEPDGGYDAKAAEWRARLPDEEAEDGN